MSIFKELATLEERIEKDSKRKDEILSEISSLINKGKEVAGNWYVKDGAYLYVSRMIHKQYWDWGCDGPLKFIKFNPKEFTCVREFMNFEDLDGFELITNEEVLSLLRPISNSLCRLPGMMDAGGNRYIKMSLVQDYRWRAIW